MKYLIGIDEVGRGSLAGPVAVGAVVFYKAQASQHLKGIRDSKKLPPSGREMWHETLDSLREKGIIDYAVSFSSHSVIDSHGIVYAVHQALARALERLSVPPKESVVLLDGGLRAPKHYSFQKTIIKGDEKERSIAAASIVAKVLRDQRMIQCAKMFPQYNFEKNKGYGTRAHCEAIKKHGPCRIHRKCFLRNTSA